MGLPRFSRRPGGCLFAQFTPRPLQLLEELSVFHRVAARTGQNNNVKNWHLLLAMPEGLPDCPLETVTYRCFGQVSPGRDDAQTGCCLGIIAGPGKHQEPTAAGPELDVIEYPRVIAAVEQPCVAGELEIRRQQAGFRR